MQPEVPSMGTDAVHALLTLFVAIWAGEKEMDAGASMRLYDSMRSSTSCSKHHHAGVQLRDDTGKPSGITGKIRLTQDLVLPSRGQHNMVTVTEVDLGRGLAIMSPHSPNC